jgi:hypothetical protein
MTDHAAAEGEAASALVYREPPWRFGWQQTGRRIFRVVELERSPATRRKPDDGLRVRQVLRTYASKKRAAYAVDRFRRGVEMAPVVKLSIAERRSRLRGGRGR